MKFHKKKLMLKLFILFSIFIASEVNAKALPDSIPKGWKATSSPDIYFGTDTTESHSGIASAIIQRIGTNMSPNGMLIQHIVADNYRGKRIKMSAYVKSLQVDKGYLYMTVNGVDTAIAFANTWEQRVESSNDWMRFQIVLDVPEESASINFAAVLVGAGTLWLDDVEITIVDQSIPSEINIIAGIAKPKLIKKPYPFNIQPVNLGFEEFK